MIEDPPAGRITLGNGALDHTPTHLAAMAWLEDLQAHIGREIPHWEETAMLVAKAHVADVERPTVDTVRVVVEPPR